VDQSGLRWQFWFEADVVVDGVKQPLRAADIALSRLHADVSQQKLNLIEFPTRLVTQPGTRSASMPRAA
jgi:hypothetical protein